MKSETHLNFIKKTSRCKDQNFEQLKPVLEYLQKCHGALIDWTVALPIAKPAKSVINKGKKAFSNNNILLTTYSDTKGRPELRKTIVEYFKKSHINCEDENIIIANSVFEIIEKLFSIIKSDSILIPTPTFGHYITQCHDHCIKTELIYTTEKNGWKLTPKQLEEAIVKTKSKLFLFNNPVNPTGIVYTKSEVEGLAKVLINHKVFCISDEIFKDVQLSDKKPYSIGAISGMENNTLTLNGVGKARGLVGLRISFACGSRDLINKLHVGLCGLSNPCQVIANEALKDTKENRNYLIKNIKKCQKNIQNIKNEINKLNTSLNLHFKTSNIPYIKPFIENPQAGTVFVIGFKGLKGKSFNNKPINTGLDIACFLYEQGGIALVPGEGFFVDKNEIALRLSSSYNKDELKRGFRVIEKTLKRLK